MSKGRKAFPASIYGKWAMLERQRARSEHRLNPPLSGVKGLAKLAQELRRRGMVPPVVRPAA